MNNRSGTISLIACAIAFAFAIGCANPLQPAETPADPVVETFVILFDSAGGSEIPSQVVDRGDLATRPLDPSRDGFTFDGWFGDPSATAAWDFKAVRIESDVTLGARWIAILSDSREMLSFSINGVEASISGGSINLTLPWGTDRKNLIATFSHDGSRVTVNGAVQTSGETPNDFEAPVEYRVFAENGMSSTYVVTVDREAHHPSLVSTWNFEDAAVPVGADVYGNNPGLSAGGPSVVPADVGDATYLDGGDSVRIESSEALKDVDSFSMSLWIKTSSFDSYKYIVDKWWYIGDDGKPVSDRSWSLNFENGNLVWRGSSNGQDSGEKRVSFPFASRADAWAHVVATWNGAELALYVDGALVGSVGLPGIESTDRPVLIGTGDHGEAFFLKGWLKDVSFYGVALTPEDVAKLFYGNAL
ncbi:MAG: InlB B-repeat-containing protein [Spirochaetes bacterium]|nr:InlB B-repeat-containing protein [Spirochaetota bacterium]